MGILSFLPGIVNIAADVLDRVIPDPVQAAAAKLQLATLNQTGELAQLDSVTKLAAAQVNVNNTEAASADVLQHWRGGAGWVCVLALGYEYLINPLGTWISGMFGYMIAAPHLDGSALNTLLFGMLGLGTLHVVDKKTADK